MSSTVTSTFQGIRLYGARLRLARGLWYFMAAFTLFLFIVGTPESFAIGLRMSPESQAALTAAGLPPSFAAYALVIMDALSLSVFTLLAFLLVRQRGEEAAALIVASMLLFTGGLYTGPTANGPLPFWMLAILPGLAETFQAWFIFTFPDGRALPKWMWWVLIPLPLWRIGIWLVDYVPTYKLIARTAENYSYTEQKAWDIGLFMALLAIGVVSQVYRYRKLSTPAQRQQTKWVLFGAVMTVVFVGTYVLVFNVFGYGENPSLIFSLAARALRQMALAILPITMAIAVMRNRLWDIDFTINRALVYGILTAVLVALFAFSLWVISSVAKDFAGSPIVAVVVAGGIFIAIFRPVRNFIQRFIDQRFYHIYIDYRKQRPAPLPPLSPESFPQTHFSAYTDLTLAGQGGMSEVYKATHPTLKRAVAIKLMNQQMREDARANHYFEREVFTLRGLNHQNIIKVLAAGEVDGRPYIVMEFIEGPVLNDVLKQQGKLERTQALTILRAVAEALDYLHAKQIVHRDVKPANVMIDEATEAFRPVLNDFGLAKVIGNVSVESQSGIAGTFAYIAPEQIQARADIDGRADIYSFGAMAYQLLTGELPFKHDNPGALLIAHMMHPAPDARDVDPTLSLATVQALQKALSKNPEERYSNALTFVDALSQDY